MALEEAYEVSGAGSSEWDGTYTDTGLYDDDELGYHVYKKDSSHFLVMDEDYPQVNQSQDLAMLMPYNGVSGASAAYIYENGNWRPENADSPAPTVEPVQEEEEPEGPEEDIIEYTRQMNVIDDDGEDDPVDISDLPGSGDNCTAILNVHGVSGTDPKLTVKIQHSDTESGSYSDVIEFEDIDEIGAYKVHVDEADLKDFVKCTYEVSGTTPKFVFGLALAKS